ncbi:putative 2OG-Fe(II) oxygenase [Sphingomonas turrisvirgatae]|uniref:Uncharacterized protein n=1 Tax=Sphingomonas turrisvirgatae TaxID=1888892 RepID=A0A1E3LVH4_9SPHN|nr:putative 2OG-Fe(II) oxygenase [Sphingomonas turrisvirgatae]ODP37781.1 hypothetical protein BFL28_02100 [Sphingomonas turrisvirgatae]
MIVDPRNGAAAVDLGLAALDNGTEASAIPMLQAAVAATPRHAPLWQVLGLLHRAAEDLAPAVAAFERAAALAPSDARIAQGLAHARLEAGLPAVPDFERAKRLAPGDLGVEQGLAAARLAELGAAAAAEGLAPILGQRPDWLQGHGLAARLRWLAGQRDRLTETIDQAIAAAPRDPLRWRQRVFILKQGELLDQALATVGRARTIVGNDLGLAFDEATLLTESGQLDAADRAFAALPAIEDPSVAVHRARHALRRGQADRIEAIVRTTLNGPGAPLVTPYLSIAWRLLGDPRWNALEGDAALIRVVDLPGDFAPLAARLRQLHARSGQPLEQSVRGGTQTDGPLLSHIDPAIAALRAQLVAAVQQHIAQLPAPRAGHPQLGARRDRPVRFAGSWSIRLIGQGFHTAHVHPDGWFSSAFYVDVPPVAAMGEPPNGWLQLGQPPADLAGGLEPFRLVEPRPGRLVLFPSTMWHGTRPIDGGERLTVAFDVARR